MSVTVRKAYAAAERLRQGTARRRRAARAANLVMPYAEPLSIWLKSAAYERRRVKALLQALGSALSAYRHAMARATSARATHDKVYRD